MKFKHFIGIGIALLMLSGCQEMTANNEEQMMIKSKELSNNESRLLGTLTDFATWVDIEEFSPEINQMKVGMDYYIDGALVDGDTEMTSYVGEKSEKIEDILIALNVNGDEQKTISGLIQVNNEEGNTRYDFTRNIPDFMSGGNLSQYLWGEGVQAVIDEKIYIGYYVIGDQDVSAPSLEDGEDADLKNSNGHLFAFYILLGED
ncbi:hypothetical protein [Alkalicoccobacillus plakortidis]|uniref:Lipoprotein n=1 Tax=Alkalicoccobacillus plakortidis TaxID=444060 RepID=A0ABT0XPB8_9BACI|nr:hypothetical protein [Alkalicoccobacillus plakortidis]MCM2677746.1 hypothetical protein [Alkalicoccobacillus plakortidis]